MPDIITNAEDHAEFCNMSSNTIVKIIVAALLETGELDADKEHVAAAYQQYRNDDTLYTVDSRSIAFSLGGGEYMVMQEDAYEASYEEAIDIYLDEAECDGRRALKDQSYYADYWQLDRARFARDIDYAGERGTIMSMWGEIYELSWAEWSERIERKTYNNRETLFCWRID